MVIHNCWFISNLINRANSQQQIAKSCFYSINLQLFADDEKTEKATPKKRQDARQKGQVFKSKEVNSAVLLLAMFLTIKYSCPMIYEEISQYFKVVFNEYMKRDIVEISTLMNFVTYTLSVFTKVMLPILLVSVLAGLISGYAQVGFLFTLEPLKVKLEKLDPIKGFKNIFSKQALVELIKSFIKIGVAIYIAFVYLKGEVNNALKLADMDIMNIFIYIGNLAINVSIAIIIVLGLLAIFDYFFQWWDYERNLKMSKHEIKEEY
ncbi:MAG: flagellar biosynthesis protein FlhB, partial [Deltaproteobacteria bacterium]